MKKIIIVLATLGLSAGVATPIATRVNNLVTNKQKSASNETTRDIANKLMAAKNIHFNFNYWAKKDLNSYLPEIRHILVQENILTASEAADVVGLLNPIPVTKPGDHLFVFDINDKISDSHAFVHINFLNDGLDATDLATKLQGQTVNLNLDNWRNKTVADNVSVLRQALVTDGLLTKDNAQYVYNGNVKWKITKVAKKAGCVFLIKKDGQIASAGNITLNVFYHTPQSIAHELSQELVDVPTSWLGRNVHFYQQQLNTIIANQFDIALNAEDCKYISWPNENQKIDSQLRPFPFVVTKNGVAIKGNTLILADL